MTNIETRIEGSEKLIGIFGYWPSFHDAEVLELHFWRGDVNPDGERYIFPVLTVKLHLWEITNDVDGRGYLGTRYHTLSTIRFHDVYKCRMEGFNHQNAIFALDINQEERSEGPSPVFAVIFQPVALGVDASLTCIRIEVLDAVPCTHDGLPNG